MNNLPTEKHTLDSLIFFCFGFTLDDSFDFIIDRVIEKAYSDATNQGAFNTKADSGKAALAKYENKTGSFYIIKTEIDNLLDGTVLDFDSWHDKTCKSLLDKYSSYGLDGIFTYGNAQKWLNMSLKYLYLLSGISNPSGEGVLNRISVVRKYRTQLHVPIDSYIIDVLWEKRVKSLPVKEGVHVDRNKSYSVPSDYIKGWSNWNDDEYLIVSKEVRSLCESNPIEWETEQWIKRAKERKRS